MDTARLGWACRLVYIILVRQVNRKAGQDMAGRVVVDVDGSAERYWNISTHQGHLFGCIALRNGIAVTRLASKNSKNTLSKTAWQPS